MSNMKIPRIELKNRKCQLGFLSKNIECLNDIEKHWLLATEIANKVPQYYKEILLKSFKSESNLNDRYIVFTYRAAGLRSQERERRAALFLGNYLNRTVILNTMILSNYHNKQFSEEPYVCDMKDFYNIEEISPLIKIKSITELSLLDIKEIICDKSKYYNLLNKINETDLSDDIKYICSSTPSHICSYLFNNKIISEVETRKKVERIAHIVIPTQCQKNKAEEVISSLGEYYAIHVRRGDLLHDDSRVKSHKGIDSQQVKYYTNLMNHIETLKKWIPLGSKIYIATDEEDLSFFDGLKKYYDIYFWKDFNIKLKPEENNSYYILSIEEIIMINSYRFISTVPSVIPVYVDYKRGFLENVDNGIYSLSFDKYFNFIKRQHVKFPSSLASSLKKFNKRIVLP